ncbi:MAG TPA: amidohydrolase family protein [Steroidobacter sp.]
MTSRTLKSWAAASMAMLTTVASAADVSWTLDGTTVYPSPDAPAIRNGHVVVTGSLIQSVTNRPDANKSPAKAAECNGGVIVAGFQNSHVHFIGDQFAHTRPAKELNSALADMLTRYGYTTVVDITSDRDNTLALRARIDKGEVRGPRILTTGLPIFPHEGLPIYISHLPKELLDKLPQPASVDEALKALRENFAAGADATKLFIATPQGNGVVKRIPPEIAQAAVTETHQRGKLVFAHPTDFTGVQAAIDAHVDIFAHPPLGSPAPWPEQMLKQAREAGMSMVPTLKLLPYELKKQQVPEAVADKIVAETVAEFGKFAAMGGQVLFGTDVGYMTDYDPTLEYELMAKAGMTPMQILASLTTTPALRWQEQARRGRLVAGMQADIVVLNTDPMQAANNFADIRCVIRGGELIYPEKARLGRVDEAVDR